MAELVGDDASESVVNVPRAGISDLLASEWSKVRHWPAGRWLLACALGLGVLATVVFVLSVRVTTGKAISGLSPHEQLTLGLMGVDFANVTMIIVAVLATCGEMSSGLVQLTLQATPRRARALIAKLVVLVGLGALVGIVISPVSYLVGKGIMAANGVTLPGLADPTALRLVLGTALMIPVHVVLAVTLGYVLRGAAVAFFGVFVVMCLPTLGQLLPGNLPDSVQWVLITPSLHTLSGVSLPGDGDYTSPPVAALVLAAWVGVLASIAIRAFRRRDF
jgi:hypothetical protein